MDKMIKSYLLRGVVVMALPLMMVGCHRTPDSLHNNMSASAHGCSGNPYLTKYDCSITKIQAAAENGDADAQYALGYMYYYGIDTVKDQQTAALWIKRAADQGQPLAKKAWSLIDSGASFNDLHRAAESAVPGQGDDTPTPSNTIVYQKPEDVSQMNSQTPSEPITNHLPGYNPGHTGTKKSAVLDNQSGNTDLHDTSAQNKPNSPVTISDPRLAGNAKPIVAQPRQAQSQTQQPAPQTSVASNKDFTVQLLASDHLSDVKNFITAHNLENKAQYFRTENQGKPWYMLTYGKYTSAVLAENALKQMPQDLKKHSPWVKSLATIEKEVQLQKIIA